MKEFTVTYVVHDDSGRRRLVLHKSDIDTVLADAHAVLRYIHPDNTYTIVSIVTED